MESESLAFRIARHLDAQQVEELRSIPADESPDLFVDVAKIFLKTTPELLEKLEQSVVQNDAEKAAKLAHSLKGSASNLGAFRLAEKSRDLEQAARCGESPGNPLLEEIKGEYRELSGVLAEMLELPAES